MFPLTPPSAWCAGIGLAAAPFLQAATDPSTAAWLRFQQRAAEVTYELTTTAAALPVPAADLTLSLAFGAMFEPVGERGLEYTPALRALDGQQVQLTGYMVREERRTAGLFLLAPQPLRLEGTACVADLPPTTVHVVLAKSLATAPVGYRPGRVTVRGVVALGVQSMPDGRNATVRVLLDEEVSQWVIRGQTLP